MLSMAALSIFVVLFLAKIPSSISTGIQQDILKDAAFYTNRQNFIQDFFIYPKEIVALEMDDTADIYLNYTCGEAKQEFVLMTKSHDPGVVDITENAEITINCTSNSTFTTNITIKGYFIGKTTLTFNLYRDGDKTEVTEVKTGYQVSVTRTTRLLTQIFVITAAIQMVLLNIAFGCGMNLGMVKGILRKPIGPIIGLSCQFIVMPLLAFGSSYLLGMTKVLGFGLFVTGCSPGGGASNVWTVMLGGDLDLSITMTFISKMAALGTMPLWLLAMGRFYTEEASFKIPYTNIVIGLLSLAVPVSIGLLIRRRRPVWADKVVAKLRPMGMFFLVYNIVFGSAANWYIYVMIVRYWYVAPSNMILTYGGYILGFLLALLFGQSKERAVTIGVETGIQDTGIAILLLQGTFPVPEGDIAATIPSLTALFKVWPLLLTFAILQLYKRRQAKPESKLVEEVQLPKSNEKTNEKAKTKETYNKIATDATESSLETL